LSREPSRNGGPVRYRLFSAFSVKTTSTPALSPPENAVLPQLEAGQGILAAALRDVEHGYLQSVQRLVVADVFTDFLDMALHLLDNGYKDPAATLIGGVLEDGLRRIAAANKLTV